ncbi:HNH endonuclease [Streptomyces roseoverticillatus]|nr:HNH endonuclease [Streptomyces roseoverticillatus]MCF3103927.1 HNH endonuclease [Streptomyces roseoverticillatus]
MLQSRSSGASGGQRRTARYDAAARLRRRIQEKGTAWCDWRLGDFPAALVDVDHVWPLALGGTDTDGNVQVPCRGCHALKAAMEFGTARCPDVSPFTRLTACGAPSIP